MSITGREPKARAALTSWHPCSMEQVSAAFPSSVEEAVEYVIDHLSASDREAVAALDESHVIKLHHGLGTWIRNQLLYPATAAAGAIRDECAALLAAETAARVAADPLFVHLAPRFEPLRPPPQADDFSEIIIRRVWRRLRGAQ
jgi:hypothetical protein